MQWRWIDRGAENGLKQMAIDEAMIGAVQENPFFTFRVYTWQPYCISIGYHQSSSVINEKKCRAHGIDVVRRPTGGRAVFHAEELTYSAVIPNGAHERLDSARGVYREINQVLVQALQSMGVDARLEKRKADLNRHYQSRESDSCFSAAARHEVVFQGKKLIGSAQRIYPFGILQHGSILMGNRHADLPDYFMEQTSDVSHFKTLLKQKTSVLNAILIQPVSIDQLKAALKQALSKHFGKTVVDSDLSDMEMEQTKTLMNSQKYRIGKRVSSCRDDCPSGV